MRAIAFSRYGAEDVLEPVELPLPEPGPGELRVRVAAAGVNPADWRIRSGQFRRFVRLRLPHVGGCDLAGIVEAAGPGVTTFAPGDAVLALQPTKVGGAYAEQAIVRADLAAAAPRTLTLREAAALPTVGLTALQALRDRAGLAPGQRLLIHGATGGVGTMAIQIARALGAHVTARTSAGGLALARELGADVVLDRAAPVAHELHGSFDVALDAVDALSWRELRHLLRPGGTAVSVNPVAGLRAPDLLAPLRGGRRLRSVFVKPDAAGLAQLAAWADAGLLRPVIEEAFPLAAAAEAQRRSATGRTRGKLVLDVDVEPAAARPSGEPRTRPASL